MPVAVDDDGLPGEPADGHAVRSEERVCQHRLPFGRQQAIEHLARVDLHGEQIDQQRWNLTAEEERHVPCTVASKLEMGTL